MAKDIQASFVIKTKVYVYESGQVQDVISKVEYDNYPSEPEIFLEMTRWITVGTRPIHCQVEKIYKLAK